MKTIWKITILSGIAVSLFYACKKDKKLTQQKKYSVNFNVSGFSQASGAFGTTDGKKTVNSLKTNALSDQVGELIVIIYSENPEVVNNPTYQGEKIYKSTHPVTDPNAGKFTAQLPPGNYTAVVIGGTNINDIVGDPVNDPDGFNTTVQPWNDVFYKKITFTVADAVLNEPVALDRITARLQINLQDDIQPNWQKITVSYTDYTYLLNLTLTPPDGYGKTGVTVTKAFTPADVGTTGYSIAVETANIIAPFTVTLTLYDTGNNIISTKAIDNVVCQSNKITVLSGNVYTNSTGFKISVDTAWHTPITQTF